MDRTQYARTCEALRMAEISLANPGPGASVDEWQRADGHTRIVATMHRKLGNFGGALRLLRSFAQAATIESGSRPELQPLAIKASTTVWAWDQESAFNNDRRMAMRAALLDAEMRDRVHDVRAIRMDLAEHEEATGNFGAASAELYAVMLKLPPTDSSLPALRDRIDDLEARADIQRELTMPASARPILADEKFLTGPVLERSPEFR